MLELYRFINMDDVEDVLLQDPTNYKTYDEGMWLSPIGNPEDQWAMSSSDTVPVDDSTRLSKMVWMEKDRTDARAVGKMSVIRGNGVRGKTDVFVSSEAASMTHGKELTIKKDTDGVVKFALAGAGEIVKAVVYMAPGNDPEGLLHFELIS